MTQSPERTNIPTPANEPVIAPLARDGKVVSWGCIIAALILLCNPMPMMIDIMPDAIAYALILFGLRRAVGEITVFKDVRKPANRLLAISLLKIPALFIMLSIWGGDSSERVILAVFTFVFSIADFICLRSFTEEFFAATARYGQVYDCPAALSVGGRSFCISPEGLEKLTLIFFTVRSVLSCLPEFTLVPVDDDGLSGEVAIRWSSLYAPAVLLSCLVLIIFGIIWACYIVGYIRRVASDKDAEARIASCITVGSRAARLNSFRLISLAMTFFTVGALLQFDIVLDGINYIPDLISAVALFLSALCLHHLLGRQIPLMVITCIYGTSTVLYYIFYTMFYQEYNNGMILTSLEAANAHTLLLAFSALSSALFIAMLILFFFAIRSVTKQYTGVVNGGLLHERMVNQSMHATPEENHAIEHSYGTIEKATKRELNIKLIIMAALGGLYALLVFLDDFSSRFTETVGASPDYTPGYTYTAQYAWVGIIMWIIGALWFCFILHLTSRIKQEAEINLIDE